MSVACKSPKRREILLYALAGGAVAATGIGAANRGLLAHLRGILAGSPDGTSALHTLARAVVFSDIHPSEAIDRWSYARLRLRIRDNIGADYRRGRIVAVGSWRISATEADALELMRQLRLI
jgi:hypothetical protein